MKDMRTVTFINVISKAIIDKVFLSIVLVGVNKISKRMFVE